MKRFVLRSVGIVLGLLCAITAAGVVWWVSGTYEATPEALAAMADEDGASDGVTVCELDDGTVAFMADDPIAGMVFYPGGNVRPEAYAPLLTRCAREGITCILVEPPLCFALASIGAANGVPEQFPDIDMWLIGGHSLGGVAAGEYVYENPEEYDALVFLASYPNHDLSAFGVEVLRLVGTNDEVVSREKLEETRRSLPAQTWEQDIDGGNHAQFGDYGEQKGDGVATITRERQQELATEAIVELAKAA